MLGNIAVILARDANFCKMLLGSSARPVAFTEPAPSHVNRREICPHVESYPVTNHLTCRQQTRFKRFHQRLDDQSRSLIRHMMIIVVQRDGFILGNTPIS